MFKRYGPVIMLVSFMALSLLFAMILGNNGQLKDELPSATDASLISDDLSLFSEFKEASREEMLNIIDNRYIDQVGIAGQDIYVTTTSGEKYWYDDESNELLFYMKFQGYEPFEISSSRIDITHNPIDVNEKADDVEFSIHTPVFTKKKKGWTNEGRPRVHNQFF